MIWLWYVLLLTHCALGSCNSTLNISFFSQAAKVTSWQTKRNVDTIKKVVKEKIRLGNVVGGPYSRVKKAHFDKLSLSQKDEIRKVVIIQRFHNCLRNKYSEKVPLYLFILFVMLFHACRPMTRFKNVWIRKRDHVIPPLWVCT